MYMLHDIVSTCTMNQKSQQKGMINADVGQNWSKYSLRDFLYETLEA